MEDIDSVGGKRMIILLEALSTPTQERTSQTPNTVRFCDAIISNKREMSQADENSTGPHFSQASGGVAKMDGNVCLPTEETADGLSAGRRMLGILTSPRTSARLRCD